jgi:hypothetical protein
MTFVDIDAELALTAHLGCPFGMSFHRSSVADAGKSCHWCLIRLDVQHCKFGSGHQRSSACAKATVIPTKIRG